MVKLNLRAKMMLIIGGTSLLVLIIGFSVIFGYISYSYRQTVHSNVLVVTQVEAAQFTQIFNRAYDDGRLVTEAVTTSFSLQPEERRGYILERMQNVFAGNFYYSALWLSLEPHALDGLDSQKAAFAPIFEHQHNQITLSEQNTSNNLNNGHYHQAISSGPFLTNPYPDGATGELIVSLILPINGPSAAAIGVMGINFDLAALQNLISEMKPFGGYTIMLANNLAMVASLNRQNLGRDVREVMPPAAASLLAGVERGETFNFEARDPDQNNQMTSLFFVPIIPQHIATAWSLGLVVNNNIIFRNLQITLMITVVVAVTVAVVLLLTIFLALTTMVKIIIANKGYLERIANGELNFKIDSHYLKRGDELGAEVRSLAALEQRLNEVLGSVPANVKQ
ncbi:MAG: cache domain-containing protein [Spirochaetaceae bacterium]|nr:cache domain-containing protein [Spirochaetaceae bacterium]